jgi:hypothetical protein
MTKLLVLENDAARELAGILNSSYPTSGDNVGFGIHAPPELARTERECELVVCDGFTVVRLSESKLDELEKLGSVSTVNTTLEFDEDLKKYVLNKGDALPFLSPKENTDVRK